MSKPSDELYTQPEWIERVRIILGSIDTDPASCEEAQKIVQARIYYTKENSGLGKPWPGNVWMNAPYSIPLAGKFADDLIANYEQSISHNALALYNSKTGTRYYQVLGKVANLLFKPKGRIGFWGPGDKGLRARNDQTFFLLSHDPKVQRRFIRILQPLGLITEPIR